MDVTRRVSKSAWVKYALKQKDQLAPTIKPREIVPYWSIFRGDTVQITEGDTAGYIGKVLKVHRSRNLIVVEGAKLVAFNVYPTNSYILFIFWK